MKLRKQVVDKIRPHTVERINELYHNLEGGKYDSRHKYMHNVESGFWESIATKYLARKEPLVCLDFGTGTGFVPLVIGKYLKKEDSFICADISSEMLKQCQHKVSEKSFLCKLSFVKIDGMLVPLQDQSVDVITLNSVLHHLYDLKVFTQECRRLLKPGGLIIASHEPNNKSSVPLFFRALLFVAGLVVKPKTVFVKLAEISPFMERVMRLALEKVSSSYRLRNKMLADIAQLAKEEGLVDFDLRGVEVQQIVDFHTQQGFLNRQIIAENFSQFKLVEWTIYNHSGFSKNSKTSRILDKFVKSNWPNAGENIRFILSLH
jgi:ubiquinone/menaquinone biosynthesis C-methylase UbiE